MERKVLLVGWDAADWKIIHTLMDADLMPATRKLVENGVMGNLSTLSPVLSPMLWTSIATGKRAYKHGIHGFVEPTPDGSGIQPITSLSRSTKAIWNILCQEGKRCHVVGWWPSSPVEPINGVMVSNHYQRAPGEKSKGWPVLPGSIHPERLSDTLAALRFHPQDVTGEQLLPFIPKGADIDQAKDRRFENVVKILADCTTIQNCATYLMEYEPWDFMAVYFDAIDHFSHGFMKYHPPKLDWVSDSDYEMYKNVVATGYVYHDMMLARLIELAGENVTVMLISDHGFHPDHLRRQELPIEPAGPAVEHREYGILVMQGPGIKCDELVHGASLLDIAPTVLHLFDLPVGEDMDGQVLQSAFADLLEIKAIPSWDHVAGDDGRHSPHRKLDQDESKQAINQLIELGYIDPPSDNKDRAVQEIQDELDYNLARSYMDGELYGEAIPLLSNLYVNNPLEFRFGIQLAICLQALNYVDDLEKLVDNIRSNWGKATEAARTRMQVINQIAVERRTALEGIESNLNGPSDRIFSDQELATIRKIKSLCKGNPSTLDYLAGWVAMSRGNYSTAVEHFNQAKRTSVNVPGFYFYLAEGYRQLCEYEQAIANYERVLELDPENAGAHLGQSRTYLAQKKNKAALNSARTALGLKYHLAPAHYCVGICMFRERKYDEAVRALETAIQINPNFSEAYLVLADIFESNLDNQEVATEYRGLAEELETENQMQIGKSILPPLPVTSESDFFEIFPEFETQNEKRLPSLIQKKAEVVSRDHSPIVIVTGLPRSGTSMVMQMLAAGGIEPYSDGTRTPDQNNPNGYLELEKVKRLAEENDWLDQAAGKCLKVISPLIPFLAQGFDYRVIFVVRDIEEVLASQKRMINRLDGNQSELDDEKLRQYFKEQNTIARNVLEHHQVPFVNVAHSETIAQPSETARKMIEFLDLDLDHAKMSEVVDLSLYRERLAGH